MIYEPSWLAVILFASLVIFVLGISVFFARKSKSSKGYFAAGGTIPWTINGIAFAGDYLSAASFLGICGMIAVAGYDGFLYSIGYLAGWIVALFVVAEPLKRLGKFTFADALDAKFNYKGIRLMAGISTLVVSVFYLIPQMVGAGALVTPLLGFDHWIGVVMVGIIVILIVATAGMKSTTYVQFIKGGLLIIFSSVIVVSILVNGLSKTPYESYHEFETLTGDMRNGELVDVDQSGYRIVSQHDDGQMQFVSLEKNGIIRWWKIEGVGSSVTLTETLSLVEHKGEEPLYNGEIKENRKFYPVGHMSAIVMDGKEVDSTGPLGPFKFFEVIQDSEIVRFSYVKFEEGTDSLNEEDHSKVTIWYQNPTPGNEILRPGLKFKVDKGSTPVTKMNFISLMIALFFGTAALPHVLIRYYTVPSPKDARKSTILAILAIGFFYILTLFIGMGAMTNGVLDVESSNMSAPLLAKFFGLPLFAIVSAIAFATVLGTVSGLIVASAGAVAHDLTDVLFKGKVDDNKRVVIGKVAAVSVGLVAIVLGIIFKGMNVSFLVGWAFSIAASANFPAIIMTLFWKKTTGKGIAASVVVGMISALGIILLSPSMFDRYNIAGVSSPITLDNPAIVSIPLSFLTLVVVSLLTKKKEVKA